MSGHVHYCAGCGDALYRCAEPYHLCGNAPLTSDGRPTREYCPDCCVSLDDLANEAIRLEAELDNDDPATDTPWQEQR